MSVLIKGWTIPKGCADCPTWCKLYLQRREFRHPDCPLIEVPTPHGRLGDLDELEKQFKRAIGTYLPKDSTRHMSIVEASRCRGWTQALTAVQEAKTVIEAEEYGK